PIEREFDHRSFAMFDRLRSLLSASRDRKPPSRIEFVPPTQRPPRELPYQPELIDCMRWVHAQLIGTFQRLVESHRRREYGACLGYVREFDRQLHDYLF